MSVFVLSESPFSLLMVLQLSISIAAWRSKSRSRATLGYFAAGVIAGLASLVRPSWLLFLPFVLVFAVILSPRRSRHLWLGLVALVGLVVTMSPWWYRNYQLMGRFIPTTLQVGASLYDGLNAAADGSSNMSFVDEFRRQERLYETGEGKDVQLTESTFEMRLDARMKSAAIRWATGNPVQVMRLMGVKFGRMWNVWPNAADLNSFWVRTAIAVGFIPLIVFGLWGAATKIHHGWPLILCLLPALYFTLLHMVFVSSIRYRQPAMLLILVIAAAALSGFMESRRKTD